MAAVSSFSKRSAPAGIGATVARLIVGAGTALLGAAGVPADFIPGRIYIPARAQGACTFPGAPYERLYEFDPLTGQHRIFLEFAYPPCSGMNGMTFTPDGTKLRASIGVLSQIDEIDGNGVITTALNAGNGIAGPGGTNNVAYDKFGNFFVVNNLTHNMMKYPAGGGPGVQFAGILPNGQGIQGTGAIDDAPDGGIYYAPTGGEILSRYTAEGQYSVFDTFPKGYGIYSVAVDQDENIFIITNNGVYRYSEGNPNSRTLLSPVLGGTLLLSQDETTLFVVSDGVFSLDPVTGTSTLLGLLPAKINGWNAIVGSGAAIAVPEPATAFLLAFVVFIAMRRMRSAH